MDGKLDIGGDEKPKKPKKKTGRPRTVPVGEKPPSRSNAERRRRARERKRLPARDKARRDILKDRETQHPQQAEALLDGGIELDEDGLTVKERIYVENFLAYGSKQKARVAAGFRIGYDPETPDVLRVLKRELAERLDRFKLDRDSVLRNLSYLEHFDPALLFSSDGSPIPVNRLPIHVRYCIEALEVEDIFEGRGEDRRWIGKLVKYKFPSKANIKALSMKHLKLLDGSGGNTKDRLDEVIAAWKAGPIKPGTVIEGQEVKHEQQPESPKADGEKGDGHEH